MTFDAFAANPNDVAVISATANGGRGGNGGLVDGTINDTGGKGAAGGAGGAVNLTYYGTMAASSTGSQAPSGSALLAQANGGFGGYGATANAFSGFDGNGSPQPGAAAPSR